MKQFIGLYAVGEAAQETILVPYTIVDSYMNCLYCTPEFFTSPHLVLPILPQCKGLYIGIISEGETREVKVVPVLYKNEKLLASLLSPEVLEQCLNTMGAIFGMVEDGEATPAYVDQDPT